MTDEVEGQEEYVPPDPLPRWAVVPGRGKCRVLAYEGNGYFTVLTNRDVKLFVHRGRCTFTNK